MIRNVIAIMLFCTYSCGLGNPISVNLSSALVELAETQCKNVTALNSLIMSQNKECDISLPPYNNHQLLCLSFYDINKQLCSALHDKDSSDLEKEYKEYVNAALDSGALCNSGKSLQFSALDNFPEYKQRMDKVFEKPFTCVKLCGVLDPMSNDTNFFCKYFKWATERIFSLKNPKTTPPAVLVPNLNITSPDVSTLPQKEKLPTAEISSSIINSKLSVNSSLLIPNGLNPSSTNREDIPPFGNQPHLSSDQTSSPNVKTPLAPSSPKPVVGSSDVSETYQLPGDDIDTSFDNIDPPGEDREPASDNNNITGEDNDDDEGDMLPPPEDIQKKINPPPSLQKVSEHSIVDVQDGSPEDDDDDNFFPFFLSAVALVALVYVMYHNKNKIMGLIVEGRQPGGRRRNSRGHAYRRLDTLEQAMSASAQGAPPSKIIY